MGREVGPRKRGDSGDQIGGNLGGNGRELEEMWGRGGSQEERGDSGDQIGGGGGVGQRENRKGIWRELEGGPRWDPRHM